MESHGLNTIDPTVATRWVTEIENKIAANKADAARNRDDLNKLFGLAEGAGINPKVVKRLVKRRAFDSQEESLSEAEKEQIELLRASIGDLPLGAWAVNNSPKKNAAAPGTVQAGMTLAEAKAILEKPKGRGRPSKERLDAERVIAEADAQIAVDAGLKPGASGEQANAMAEAMGDDRGENVEDLRPRFMQTPPEAA